MVGTRIKRLLRFFGFAPSEDQDCLCDLKAEEMDEKGPAWVKDHYMEVIKELETAAWNREVLFHRYLIKHIWTYRIWKFVVRTGARVLVTLALWGT